MEYESSLEAPISIVADKVSEATLTILTSQFCKHARTKHVATVRDPLDKYFSGVREIVYRSSKIDHHKFIENAVRHPEAIQNDHVIPMSVTLQKAQQSFHTNTLHTFGKHGI